MHLLKHQHQLENQSNSWVTTIDHHRDEIKGLFLDSPSLRIAIDDASATICLKAVRDA